MVKIKKNLDFYIKSVAHVLKYQNLCMTKTVQLHYYKLSCRIYVSECKEAMNVMDLILDPSDSHSHVILDNLWIPPENEVWPNLQFSHFCQLKTKQ